MSNTQEEIRREILKKHSVYMCDNPGVHAAMKEYADLSTPPQEGEAKAIAEAAFTAGELYGSDNVNVLKPGGEIYPKKE